MRVHHPPPIPMQNYPEELAALQEEYAAFKERHVQQVSALQQRVAELEQVVLHTRTAHGILFLRGPGIGEQWQPFCPLCKAPGLEDGQDPMIVFCSGAPPCTWSGVRLECSLAHIIRTLGVAHAA